MSVWRTLLEGLRAGKVWARQRYLTNFFCMSGVYILLHFRARRVDDSQRNMSLKSRSPHERTASKKHEQPELNLEKLLAGQF